MKLRVIGTKEECALAREYYNSLRGQENVKYVCVSGFYACRGSADLFRIYIEVAYFDTVVPMSGYSAARALSAPGGAE